MIYDQNDLFYHIYLLKKFSQSHVYIFVQILQVQSIVKKKIKLLKIHMDSKVVKETDYQTVNYSTMLVLKN